LLNTIRYAEGTWKQGKEGYRTLYGGGRFSSLERHPEIVVVKRYTSAAAGAYQFLPGTWSEAARKLQLESFGPSSQDQAALYLVDRRGVLDQIDQQGLTREAMAVLIPHLFAAHDAAAITAETDPRNAASIALLTRFGFRETHRAERTLLWRDEWCDSVCFALDRRAWPPAVTPQAGSR
jgi:L-amino acid N-acyltransferase YncA